MAFPRGFFCYTGNHQNTSSKSSTKFSGVAKRNISEHSRCCDPLQVAFWLAALEWWDLAEDAAMDITSTIKLFLISL